MENIKHFKVRGKTFESLADAKMLVETDFIEKHHVMAQNPNTVIGFSDVDEGVFGIHERAAEIHFFDGEKWVRHESNAGA